MNFNDIITLSCGILGTGKLEQNTGHFGRNVLVELSLAEAFLAEKSVAQKS